MTARARYWIGALAGVALVGLGALLGPWSATGSGWAMSVLVAFAVGVAHGAWRSAGLAEDAIRAEVDNERLSRLLSAELRRSLERSS